ncbi:MAG: Yip1 family protein [Bacillota bacterium]|nr:Yip1 family protein [Bacillota bacterium]
MFDKIINWLSGVITMPVATLNEVAKEKPAGLAFLVYTFVLILTSIVAVYSGAQFSSYENSMLEIGFQFPLYYIALAMIPFGIISLFISTLLIHLFARLFGGKGQYWNLFSAYAFANFPMIINVPISFLLGFLGIVGGILSGLFGFALSIWILVLQVIAIRESHSLSTGMSILTYLIQVVILFAAVILVIIAAVFTYIGAMQL